MPGLQNQGGFLREQEGLFTLQNSLERTLSPTTYLPPCTFNVQLIMNVPCTALHTTHVQDGCASYSSVYTRGMHLSHRVVCGSTTQCSLSIVDTTGTQLAGWYGQVLRTTVVSEFLVPIAHCTLLSLTLFQY